MRTLRHWHAQMTKKPDQLGTPASGVFADAAVAGPGEGKVSIEGTINVVILSAH